MVARQLSDYARALVPTVGEAGGVQRSRGEYVVTARRARLHALALLQAAVLLEYQQGATWEEIAGWLGVGWTAESAEAAYGPLLAGDGNGPALEGGGRGVNLPPVPASPGWSDADELDRWCVVGTDPADQVAVFSRERRPLPGGPVTRELE